MADGDGELTRTESAAVAAGFWASLLKDAWLALQKEEEAALARTMRDAPSREDLDVSPHAVGAVGARG